MMNREDVQVRVDIVFVTFSDRCCKEWKAWF